MRPNLENKIINLMIRLQTCFVITFYLFYFDGIAESKVQSSLGIHGGLVPGPSSVDTQI